MNKKDKIKIFVAYHKDAQRVKSDILTPIHVGRAVASEKTKAELSDMIGDDTGDNISVKNPNYCELTALYWAWKNCDADYVGLCHYRRFFNLNFYNSIDTTYNFTPDFLKTIKMDDKSIEDTMKNLDIVLPSIYNTHPFGLPKYTMTNYDFYCQEHTKEHLDTVIDIIHNDFPQYSDSVKEYMQSKKSFFFNMFIMKRKYFDDYMEWLFHILNKVEKELPIPEDAYQSRIYGFLAERLLNIFIIQLKKQNPSIKIYHTNSVVYSADCYKPVHLNKTKISLGQQKYLNSEETSQNEINIVFSVDDKYIQHCSATIASILLNSAKGNHFNFYILDGGISLKNKEKLNKLKKLRDFNVTYIKINNDDFKDLPLNRSYISIATYYRLLLPQILPSNVNKVIYLDADIIVESDISEFWNTDISDYACAAVEDEGSLYQIKRLKLPIKNLYFNAGVMLFNIDYLRKNDFIKNWQKYFNENKDIILLQDQDILNGTLNGKCKFLPLKWNANGRIYSNDHIIEHEYTWEEATEAAHHPAIIHYTDKNKPWMNSCNHPLKDEYLKYLEYTPWKHKIPLYKSCYVVSKFIKPVQINRRKFISLRWNKHEKSLRIFGRIIYNA